METRLFYKIAVITSIFLLFIGCSHRQNITEQQIPGHTEIPSYTRHLKGFKICLDPGHGGQAHIADYKRGPTGVREAEVNLQVALHLRNMLQEVGATVIMTRVDDSYVSLPTRSQIANESDADFFISLHHNGIDNPETNYTSTWYHGDADDSRQSLDLARYVQQGVSDALRLPNSPATGLFSDKLVTTSGFGVLRLTQCPAVLCEASFLSNPEEEGAPEKRRLSQKRGLRLFSRPRTLCCRRISEGYSGRTPTRNCYSEQNATTSNSDYGWPPPTRRVDAQTTAGLHRHYPN